MNKKQIQQTYLDIIQQSSIGDSLGGKLIKGLGSVFKKGSQLAVKGVKAGSKKVVKSIKDGIQQHKNTENAQQLINSLKQIFNLNQSLTYKISKKAEIQYMLNTAGSSFNSSLVSFLNIFKQSGKAFGQLIKDNDQILGRSQEQLEELIKAPLIKQIDTFKQNSKLTMQEEFISAYKDILCQAIQDELIQKAGKNGFLPPDPAKANELFKQITINSLPANFFAKLPAQLNTWQSNIKNDKIKLDIKINNSQIIGTIQSEFLKKKSSMIPIVCTNTDKFNIKIIELIVAFYKKEYDQQVRAANLNTSMNNAKYSKYELVFKYAQNIIIQMKFSSWFNSLMSIIQNTTKTSINEEDLKFLSILYYQYGIIDIIK